VVGKWEGGREVGRWYESGKGVEKWEGGREGGMW